MLNFSTLSILLDLSFNSDEVLLFITHFKFRNESLLNLSRNDGGLHGLLENAELENPISEFSEMELLQ